MEWNTHIFLARLVVEQNAKGWMLQLQRPFGLPEALEFAYLINSFTHLMKMM
jgi:hypothetical protein